MMKAIRKEETGEVIRGKVSYDSKRMLILNGTHDGQEVVVMYNKLNRRFYPPHNNGWAFIDPLQLVLESLD